MLSPAKRTPKKQQHTNVNHYPLCKGIGFGLLTLGCVLIARNSASQIDDAANDYYDARTDFNVGATQEIGALGAYLNFLLITVVAGGASIYTGYQSAKNLCRFFTNPDPNFNLEQKGSVGRHLYSR